MKTETKTKTYHGKPCYKCGSTHRYSGSSGCIACMKASSRQRWRDKGGATGDWAAQRRAKYASDPSVRLDRKLRNLKEHYGLTKDAFDAMLEDQGYSCAICGVEHEQLKTGLHVDHDHSTGYIRALLCGNCNRGLGAFLDDPKIAEQAASYLRKYGKA